MFQSISCELCINICNGHRRLYDDDGLRNEVYAMTKKYFSPMLESVDNFAVICLECWRHIFEFHTFQQSIKLAHEIGQFSKRAAEVVKSREENLLQGGEEFTTIASKSVVVDDQWPREVRRGENDSLGAEANTNEDSQEAGASVRSERVEPMDDHESVSCHGGQQSGASLKSDDPDETEMADEWDDLVDITDDIIGEYQPESQGDFSSDAEISVAESADDPKTLPNLGAGEQLPTTSRLKSRRPQTIQEYDDLIAKWRPTLECEECGDPSPSFSQLQQHFAEQHPTAKCHIVCCDRKLSHRYELETHIRSHIEAKPFKCEQCYRRFTTAKSLETHHYRMHYGTSKNGFQCPKCSKTYARKDIMTYHAKYRCKGDSKQGTSEQAAAADNKHTCGECGKVLTTSRLLQDHVVKFHAAKKERPAKPSNNICNICDKVFTRRITLREHMGTHTGQPMYKCHYCPKTFKLRSTYYHHLNRWHRQEWSEKLKQKAELKKTTKCSLCECVCDNQDDLRVHMAKHAGKPLYTCPFCPRIFIFRAGLTKHLLLLHSREWAEKKEASDELGRKIFKCASCEEGFNTSRAWRNHQDTH